MPIPTPLPTTRHTTLPNEQSSRCEITQRHKQRLDTLHRLQQQLTAVRKVLSSGYAALDAILPGNGWPQGSLIEVIGNKSGHSELQLFMPLLQALNQAGRYSSWVQPPHIPYLPGLIQYGLVPSLQLLLLPKNNEDGLWSMEQLLRNQQCGVVLAWLQPKGAHCLRRLQLAAEHGNSFAILYRPAAALNQASTAAIRLSLSVQQQHLQLRLHKVRGGQATSLRLPLAELATHSKEFNG